MALFAAVGSGSAKKDRVVKNETIFKYISAYKKDVEELSLRHISVPTRKESIE